MNHSPYLGPPEPRGWLICLVFCASTSGFGFNQCCLSERSDKSHEAGNDQRAYLVGEVKIEPRPL